MSLHRQGYISNMLELVTAADVGRGEKEVKWEAYRVDSYWPAANCALGNGQLVQAPRKESRKQRTCATQQSAAGNFISASAPHANTACVFLSSLESKAVTSLQSMLKHSSVA